MAYLLDRYFFIFFIFARWRRPGSRGQYRRAGRSNSTGADVRFGLWSFTFLLGLWTCHCQVHSGQPTGCPSLPAPVPLLSSLLIKAHSSLVIPHYFLPSFLHAQTIITLSSLRRPWTNFHGKKHSRNFHKVRLFNIFLITNFTPVLIGSFLIFSSIVDECNHSLLTIFHSGDYDEAIFMFGHHHNISEKYDGNERELLFGEDIDRGLVTEAGWC